MTIIINVSSWIMNGSNIATRLVVRAMLRRTQLCHSTSSVRSSVCLSVRLSVSVGVMPQFWGPAD